MLGQQFMQIDEGGYRRVRCTQFHACTSGSVEHPCRHDQDYAGCDLDVNNITCCSLFAVLPSKATTIERMPAVKDFDFLPDMGRMTPRLHSGAQTGCSPGVCAQAREQPR